MMGTSLTLSEKWSDDLQTYQDERTSVPAPLGQRVAVHEMERNAEMGLTQTTNLGTSLGDMFLLHLQQLPS